MLIPSILLALCLPLFTSAALETNELLSRAKEHYTSPLSTLDLPDDEYGATVFALLYGYPLPSFTKTFQERLGLTALGTNNFFHFSKLSTPGDTTVVRPNVDTIYGVSILDLSHEDVVITVPPMQSDRYYLYAFYDPFGDEYGTVGSLDRDKSGEYLLRPSLKTGKAGRTSTSCGSRYAGCIDAPTLNGLLLVRVEAIDGNETDIRTVDKYLRKVKVKAGEKRAALGPAFRPRDLKDLSKDKTLQALQLTALLAERNPPQNLLFSTLLPWALRTAGIYGGKYHPSPNVNLTQVTKAWDKITAKFYADPENNIPLNNGWSVLSPVFSGSFQHGINFIARSFVAKFAYLQNVATQAIYPTPSQQTYTLSSGEAYVLTFSGKPPIDERVGFWSLTMYNAKGELVRYPIKRYALGNNYNLTYSNGKPVYRGSDDAVDKEFQILVQASNVTPPSNWTSNWLPAPHDGDEFQLTMRLYAPGKDASNGAYEYPRFEKRSAIAARG